MKVAHVINSVSTGGAESILLNSINGFKKYWPESEHYLIVLYRDTKDKRLVHFKDVHHLNSSLKKIITHIPSIRTFLKKNKIEVIHSHLWDSLIISRLAKPKNCKLVHTYHSIDYQPNAMHHSKWRIFLDRITYQGSPIVYVSKPVLAAVQSQIKSQKKKGRVVNNFFTEDFSYAWNDRRKDKTVRMIAVGSLRKAKNYELLIETLDDSQLDFVEVDIYGEGLLKEELSNQIKKSAGNIRLMGNKKITSDLFGQYNIFIMTSVIEGMPVALLEAMASGMPSILPAYLPVMNEIAGEGAYYFTTKESLKETLLNIADNELHEKSMIAKERSKTYSLATYISLLKEIYLST